MTEDQMKQLQPGDVIRHTSGGDGYMVTANYGTRVTAVRTVDVTNPDEWVVAQASTKLGPFASWLMPKRTA